MRTALVPLMMATLVAALAMPSGAPSHAQGELKLGIDATPAGNTATSLASVDSCVSVAQGKDFQVDIFVIDALGLLAWEAYLAYDPAVVSVVGRDVQMFQAGDPGSSVFDLSETAPGQDDGLYRVGSADLIDPPAGDSGSGVLARITLRAVGEGQSSLTIDPTDLNDDGELDLGPLLTDVEGGRLNDANADGFADGPFFGAEVVVGGDCQVIHSTPVGEPVAPSGPAPADTGGGSTAWWVAGSIAGGLAALLAVALLLWRRRGRGPFGEGPDGPASDSHAGST